MVTCRLAVIRGFKNMCPFGSSTSQSRYWTLRSKSAMQRARFVAIVVFPVPPLPLAIAITNLFGILAVHTKVWFNIWACGLG